MSDADREKEMKAFAGEVMDFMWRTTAGEMGRRVSWELFVKHLPHDHNLMELSDECFNAMSDEQKRRFLDRLRARLEDDPT